ncbi:Heme NO binding protein [Jannaschia aquimarina]|uniref:Heme NO binding protein n=2 Tax=Jannaschia aquimarina TaxID=935700 RepID=A0A0D1D7V9_9RHOB|nr:heme NO-binding domain-containing protein [Jannaschia aquimarina]KIT16048.1 Heme NO binding protein [Jannaschia aquimarina]SNT01047.1 Haem-NO-binding [Jannaschia aquimarina]
MHGLICKGVGAFLSTRYGEETWAEIGKAAGLGFAHFEATRTYGDAILPELFAKAGEVTDTPPAALAEDFGHWLCTHPPLEPVRRLIRFSGASFEEMLFSLEELHERAHMALPDLDLPVFSLIEKGDGAYRIASTWSAPGAGPVLSGMLRAMADDYGVLAVLDFVKGAEVNGAWTEVISVRMLDPAFAAGRSFELGGAA